MSKKNTCQKLAQYYLLQRSLLGLTFFVLFLSLYFEYVVGMQPCPLCLMQRLCAFLLVICCGVSLFVSHTCKLWIITFIQMFFAGSGVFFAGRQIWLQFFPADHTAMCMPAMSLLLKYFSWSNVLQVLFWGGSDCSENVGYFLGLSMPMWSALCFGLMLILCCGLLWALISREARNN